MIDNRGRNIDYLRVSITDRCNLRCVYCMPREGIQAVPYPEMLTLEEIGEVCAAAATLGITKIKLTGGEPLVRKGCVQLVEMLKATPGIREVTMTTNGVLLPRELPGLVKAGLDAVNISLDTLDPAHFEALTRVPLEGNVREAIDQALEAGIRVKVNSLAIEEYNGKDLVELASLARDRKLDVRFIELMPIGLGSTLTPIANEEVRRRLEEAFGPMELFPGRRGNGPAVYYSATGFTGKLGFISAISHEFCQQCNRVRLTSTGFLKLCLHYSDGVPLRELVRSGVSREELAAAIQDAVLQKPLHHTFSAACHGSNIEHLTMAEIGG